MALQTIVARNVDPSQPAVVTVGSMHAGTANNVISSSAKLELSVRSFSPEGCAVRHADGPLIRLTGSKLAPAGYVAACVVLSLIAVSMLKETADKAID